MAPFLLYLDLDKVGMVVAFGRVHPGYVSGDALAEGIGDGGAIVCYADGLYFLVYGFDVFVDFPLVF